MALPRMRESIHSRREADRIAYGDCQRAGHAARTAAAAARAAGQPDRAQRYDEEAARWQKRADAYFTILSGSDPSEYEDDVRTRLVGER